MGVTWSREFTAVSSLTAASSRIVASVGIATKPHLTAFDPAGSLTWRRAVPEPALIIGGRRSVFAAAASRIMILDAADGALRAARDVDPPPGGWTRAATLSVGDDFLVADAHGVEQLRGGDLVTLWKVTQAIDGDDTIQQLAYERPLIAAVSNRTVMAISESGELRWTRRLPAETRLAGDHPLVMMDRRMWIGLVKQSDPRVRYLYEVSASDGSPRAETAIGDLAMFCPAHASGTLLVLDTQRGFAAFDIASGLTRRWSIEAPAAVGTGVRHEEHLLIATRDGEVLRVALVDGQTETLIRLPRRPTWVPPAPDVSPGVHSESAGEITGLVALPSGVAFSTSWSRDQAVIQFRPW